MENIEEQILRYPDLPPDEQEDVETRASGHPRWEALLRDVKALANLLAQARALGATAPSDEALARYLTTPRTGATLPPALTSAFDEIEAALQDEERGDELRARVEALTRRLRTLEAETRDPAAHFEALTGHTLDEEQSAAGAVEENAEIAEQEQQAPAGEAHAERTRRAARLWALLHVASLPRWARYGTALVLALVVLYGGLFVGGRLAQSKMERLAAVNEDRLSVEGYGLQGMRTRGGAGALSPGDSSASLDARYLRSLRLLRAARTSTLGLFPHYDEATARRAERQLEAVSQEAEGGSFVQLEALFFLGKARLALGDKSGATKALRKVVIGGGRLGPQAQKILETLYEDAAYDGPPAGA